MNKIYYSWEQFDKDCERLARWAKQFDFLNIYGIPRSGIMVATRLSYLLNIPLVICEQDIDPDNTLIVDDISKTGSTIEKMEDNFGHLMVATLIWNKQSPEPDYYCRKKDGDVLFPWKIRTDSLLEGGHSRNIATPSNIGDGAVKINKKGLA